VICHNRRVIFIHIPKCAGTSIEDALGHFHEYSGWGRQDHRTIRHIEPLSNFWPLIGTENRLILQKRHRIRKAREKNPRNNHLVSRRQFNRYYKFTIIRDPWSRVWSWYRNMMRDERHREKLPKDMQFNEFVHSFAGKGMLAPFDYWTKKYDGSCAMDRVIRFDDLRNGLRIVAEEANLPELLQVPHLLKSNDNTTAPYTRKLQDLIGDTYGKEIRRFNFRFEG
jgi:hypothetical protein